MVKQLIRKQFKQYPILPGLIFLLLPFLLPSGAAAGLKTKVMLQSIILPPGFSIDVYTENVTGARSLTVSPSGVVYVGTRQSGCVYAVVDDDHDFHADRVIPLIQGLSMPNGVAFDQGDLFVADVGRILRFPDIEAHLDNPGQPEVVFDQLPQDLEHGWKYIGFGPDGRLYVSIGAPCNACLGEKPVYATIARMQRDGGNFEIFAHGVRNSLGFDWHPQTGDLWFTDNGRDWMGDDLPPDELNYAPAAGYHFGFPYCHGAKVPDPQLGSDQACTNSIPPALQLEPHVAALGMRFYTGNMFPPPYRGQIFIAEHGSWNRSRKIGYQISLVQLVDNRPVSYVTFAKGWLLGERAWGRPVDVVEMIDGSLLVSDDQNGVIYRISFDDPNSFNRAGQRP